MDKENMIETKSEIRARISELERISAVLNPVILDTVKSRISDLIELEKNAEEDPFKSVLKSHKVLCEVKEMDEDAAYGQDPALYYALAISGEAGEMGNKIVKALRNGDDPEAAKRAVISELPDVIIYSAVLAHVLEIDLSKLVNEKVGVVISRARDGYYGGPLNGKTRTKKEDCC